MGRRRGGILPVGLALVAILLAACTGTATVPPSAGGSTPAGSDGGGVGGLPDACALLSTDEIEAAVGEAMQAGEPRVASDQNECTWNGLDETQGVLVVITLEAFDSFFWDGYNDDPGASPVPGVGDEAIRSSLGWMYIRKGSIIATFSVVSTYDPYDTVLDWQASLGQLAASRLP